MSDKEANKLGVFGAMSYIVGTVIGSGIFVSPTAILMHAGSPGLSLIIWFVGGCIAMLTAIVQFIIKHSKDIVFIELGTSIRESGGEFAYITYVGWHPFAFAFLWSTTLITSSCSCAILATTFGSYVIEAVQPVYCLSAERTKYAVKLCGFTLLLLLSWTNFFSLKKYAARIQIVITIAKLLSVGIIIVTGFYFLIFKGRTENFTNGKFFAESDLSASSIVLAVYGGVWAYSGYDVLNYGAEDIKNFKRTLPIAVVGGLFISIMIYLMTNVAYFTILTPQEMLDSSAVATTFSKATLGNFYYAMPAIVAILMMGTLNSDIFMFSRFMFSGARRGKMPTIWALMNEEHESPRVAVVFHAVFAITFSFIGSIGDLINYMIVCGMLQQVFAVAALLWIRIRKIEVHPEAIKFPIIFPTLLILVSASLIIIPIWSDLRAAAVGFGVVIFWLAVYFLFERTYPVPFLCYINGMISIFFFSSYQKQKKI